jgi:hypothetical protein
VWQDPDGPPSLYITFEARLNASFVASTGLSYTALPNGTVTSVSPVVWINVFGDPPPLINGTKIQAHFWSRLGLFCFQLRDAKLFPNGTATGATGSIILDTQCINVFDYLYCATCPCPGWPPKVCRLNSDAN